MKPSARQGWNSEFPEEPRKKVCTVESGYIRLFVLKDDRMTVLNKVWANDESVTVFESGHANYGWADYRDHHLMPEMKEMKNTKYTLSDIKVKLAGMTAWATFKYTISADVGARHVDGGGLGTAVLEKRDGRWQIVHWHSSAPRRAPTSGAPAKP